MTEENKTEKNTLKKRKLSAAFIFVAFGLVMIAMSYKPSIETVYCNTETLTPKPEVIMLGASWCPYCYQARRYFVEHGVNYCEYDIEDGGKGEQLYSKMNNTEYGIILGIPILFIGEQQFSGYDEKKIEQALAKLKAL